MAAVGCRVAAVPHPLSVVRMPYNLQKLKALCHESQAVARSFYTELQQVAVFGAQTSIWSKACNGTSLKSNRKHWYPAALKRLVATRGGKAANHGIARSAQLGGVRCKCEAYM